MTNSSSQFRALHAPGRCLVLPNAWDAGSAAIVAACGAEAMATTSAGLAWSQGYPDGDALPVSVLKGAVAAIVRVITVPLTVDIEAGYSDDPRAVGELVAALAGAGAVGVNLEDGAGPPELLCAKIAAARSAADVFVNARTDVYLRRLAAPAEAVAMTLERAGRYRAAGADGVFVPGVTAPADIRAIASGIGGLPLNVMAMPALPPADELQRLGVRRLSAGAALAAAVYGRARRLATQFLADGRSAPFGDDAVGYAEMNALFAPR